MSDNTALLPEKGSFRDRNNQVFIANGRVLRGISENTLAHWRQLERSAVYQKYSASGAIIGTQLLETMPGGPHCWTACLEHERVPFINYSYEWCFEMIKDAALLHLDLLEDALGEDIIIKDSSSFNIQFVGARPVSIDIPSFETYVPGTPWVGFRQFCQHFLYPLMLQSWKNISFRPWLRGSIEGFTPQECN